ncbi:cytochrome c oxidase subunit II [Luteimonas endophytica]|uniref:cytochrome c oxidase subunit II n=1 Tax=Luteimonas endophytica TaxID=3042023 RepID=UPI002F40B0B7
MQAGRFKQWALGLAAMALSTGALAQSADPQRWQLNMGRGVTATSQNAYEAHMFVLWVCVVIGVIVFGAMAVAMFRFRKSKGAVAAQFSHNTTAEVIWTIVPIVILVVMAVPATSKLIAMYDVRDSEMTVKVTGYQWMWAYEYLGEDVAFTSRMDRDSDRLRQNRATTRAELDAHPAYLLEVDNELVLPVDTKVRFVVTADDVIHSWWVPALGWKQDAIPGLVNEAWTEIREPGVYRGQCAELCGKDHAFMPIVVRAVPRDEFDAWLAARKADSAPQEPSVIDEEGSGTAPRGVDPDMIEDAAEGEEPALQTGIAPAAATPAA